MGGYPAGRSWAWVSPTLSRVERNGSRGGAGGLPRRESGRLQHTLHDPSGKGATVEVAHIPWNRDEPVDKQVVVADHVLVVGLRLRRRREKIWKRPVLGQSPAREGDLQNKEGGGGIGYSRSCPSQGSRLFCRKDSSTRSCEGRKGSRVFCSPSFPPFPGARGAPASGPPRRTPRPPASAPAHSRSKPASESTARSR